MVASNTNGTAKDNLCLIDTMPNNKDGKSVINGIYNLTSVTVNKKLLKDEDNLTLWYTNEDSYIGKTAKDINSSEISKENGWKQARRTTVTIDGVEYYSFTGDGLVADENGKAWPSVIAYKQDSLKSNTKVVLRLNYSSIAAEKDKLQNVLTTMSGDSEIDSDFTPEVYKRSLEGTVWEDKDKDGKLEKGETKLGKVKVTLYQKQADGSWKPYEALKEMVKNEDGTYEERTCPSTIETDENGHYKFTGLPEGEFKVEFSSSDDENGTKLTDYKVTKDHASENDEETSKVESDHVETDADNENILKSGNITNIKMPSIEEMSVNNTKSYNLPNQNLGLTKETTSVEVNKTWNDNEDQDGIRPDDITVNLLADGQKVKSAKITADKNWKYTFTGLDKYKDGQVINYTISEDEVEGYTSDINGFDITNTHVPGTTSVKVTKAWDDKDNQDGIRPDKVVVNLYADNKKTDQSMELNEANNWTATFENLPAKSAKKDIAYTVKEEAVTGYTSSITGNATNGYTITNQHTPETTSVEVNKTWNDSGNQDGIRPDDITVNLLADGQKVKSAKITADKNWKYTFTGLDKYKDGQVINYTISEDEVEGYTSDINGFDITNTHVPGTTSVKVTKAWDDKDNQDGIRPDKVVVNLYADNKKTDQSMELNEANNWTATFENLPAKSAKKDIAYTVREETVTGYTSSITGNATNAYTVTNTHNPEKVSIKGQKTWQDKDNQDGIRPEKITVKVMNGNNVVATQEVTSTNNWKYTFEGLDKYKDGQVITYTINEDEVEGYTTSYDGYNITNTHDVETTSVKVTKEWDDHDNQDGKRPGSVVVHLYANGEKTDQTVELSNDNNWMAVFDNLDKFKDGQAIQYTVEEEKVNNYKATVTGDQDQGFVITNTYQKDSTPVVDQSHSDKPSQNNKSNSKKSHVSTGDNQEVGLFGLMGLLSLGGLTFLNKKRKED